VRLAAETVDHQLRQIALATLLTIEASTHGSVRELDTVLSELEASQRATGQNHYLGVTLLNRAIVGMVAGDVPRALGQATEAADLLARGLARGELWAALRCRG
jgi:hypothetical protein